MTVEIPNVKGDASPINDFAGTVIIKATGTM